MWGVHLQLGDHKPLPAPQHPAWQQCAAGRWKSPGHWAAQPTARTAQMELKKLLLEVGYERGFNNTSLNQRAWWLHNVSRRKKREKAVQNLRKRKWKGYNSWEEDVGERRKASLLSIQCLNLGYLKAPLLPPWSNNYSSLGTLISSAGPRWQIQHWSTACDPAE